MLFAAFVAAGCRCENGKDEPKPAGVTPSATASALPSGSVTPLGPLERTSGSSIAVTPDEHWLLVANETNASLEVVELPLGKSPARRVPLPGAPAQLVTDGATVWATVRHPSSLWIGRFAGGTLTEAGRVELPDDAWGLAVSSDRTRAIVTSAWTARVSVLDLKGSRVSWSLPVAREPRGIVLDEPANAAWITHLAGSDVSRISLDAPGRVERTALPAAPLRSGGKELGASLGYAAALSPDGSRLFAPRHALGALGKNAWFGAATVDVLMTAAARPAISGARPDSLPHTKSALASQLISGNDTSTPGPSLTPFVQPRAVIYRKRTDTLLVAGEGNDRVAELDATAPDPTMAVVAVWPVGEHYHAEIHVAADCAAPAGLALSRDEARLWVHCGASNDLAELNLTAGDADAGLTRTGVTARLSFGDDPLGPGGATGRKLFYSALDAVVSGGLGCAGCHPEGRDDGHVWHEATFSTEDGEVTNFLGDAQNIPAEAHARGHARRTPMLAGRVYAKGPYGWHGESDSLEAREMAGFTLHRWGGVPDTKRDWVERRAKVMADFLRRGLTPPARTKVDEKDVALGRAVFMSPTASCSKCHDPDSGYSTRSVVTLPALPPRDGFDADPNDGFKIPALTFLEGRAPYFHDGSAASLEALIAGNKDRMGQTTQLSPEDTQHLIAFLRSL